jgi:hypothetical protein
MKRYYNGFCFDGQTLVYCPFSTLRFFTAKRFDNFWFNSGTPEQLISFLKKRPLSVAEFRGISVSRHRVLNPSSDRFYDPAIFLYQLGYLSLRPSQDPKGFKLDYPNVEALETLSLRVLESLFDSAQMAEDVGESLRKAAIARDPAALVSEFNKLLSRVPYDDCGEVSLNESFYLGQMLTLLYAARFSTYAELQGKPGRSDLAFELAGQIWVLEIKLNHKVTGDEDLAAEALKQITDRNYGGRYRNPVLLGLVVNGQKRLITAWKCLGGRASEPEGKEPKPNLP